MRRTIVLGGIVAGVVVVAIGATVPLIIDDPSIARTHQVSPGTSVALQSPSVAATSAPARATIQPRPTEIMPAATLGATPMQPGAPIIAAVESTTEASQISITAQTEATPAREMGDIVVQDTRTAAFVIMQPEPATMVPATPSAGRDSGHVGLHIRSPADGGHVSSSAVVSGDQQQPTPHDRHLWAFVKADVADSRWYPWHRGEILPGADNTWAIDLYLGGTTGTQHEVRIGTVDDARHAALSTFLNTNPDQPVSDLPDGFLQEAQLTVTLE